MASGRVKCWLRDNAFLIVPALVLILFASSTVTFMLPSCDNYLGENYQPLRALKFFKTLGQDYHKYGPVPNFLLAPGYGASLAYWYLRGEFKSPSDDFPYGFQNPFQQMGFLMLQGRALFLLLGILATVFFGRSMLLVTEQRLPVFVALFFCIATNTVILTYFPNDRPDGPMLIFALMALGVYLRIMHFGLTPRRGFALSAFAVLAISSKEQAATMFVLPYLGLGWAFWRETRAATDERKQYWRSIASALITGFGLYVLLNIVYAPGVWLERMRHWTGVGTSSEVWGGNPPPLELCRKVGLCLLDNFGPGGAVVVLVGLGAYALRPPRQWLLLLLPFVSFMVLGVFSMGYTEDRFLAGAAIALAPVVAVGLSGVTKGWAQSKGRPVLASALIVLVLMNCTYATFIWLRQSNNGDRRIERHVRENRSKDEVIYLWTLHPRIPGKHRLEGLFGFKLDHRPLQDIVDDESSRPPWIYVDQAGLAFVEDCRLFPRRAEMLKADSGFDFEKWPGIEGLGYSLDATLRPSFPWWFPFRWMPGPHTFLSRGAVFVYKKQANS